MSESNSKIISDETKRILKENRELKGAINELSQLCIFGVELGEVQVDEDKIHMEILTKLIEKSKEYYEKSTAGLFHDYKHNLKKELFDEICEALNEKGRGDVTAELTKLLTR